jgi:hypothetical protein
MPLLQVRDFPEDVYIKIALAAKRSKRTIAQQTIVLLEASLGHDKSNLERRRQLLEKLGSREVPEAVQDIDAVALLREDRDR